MNIFEEYLNKILDKIKLASEEKLILLPESLSGINVDIPCLLYTSPSPRDRTRSRMPSSA